MAPYPSFEMDDVENTDIQIDFFFPKVKMCCSDTLDRESGGGAKGI